MLSSLELTGRVRTHIIQNENPRFAVHRDVLKPYQALCSAARADGFEIEAFSAFRDFDAQLSIWNRKFKGERVIHDRNSQPLNHATMTNDQRVEAILFWSALPGASRHHWGTEIDVIARNIVPENYDIQLLPTEYEPGGVFFEFNQWLTTNMETYGFFRPYHEFRGGVSQEPWHLSYWPISKNALEQFELPMLIEAIQASSIEGKDNILKVIDRVFQTHVTNICLPFILT